MNSDNEFARAEAAPDPDDHTVVAAFAGKNAAQRAVKALHDEGFHKTWIGVTCGDTDMDAVNESGTIGVRVEDDSIGGKIGRFFSGGKSGTTLNEALQRYGVSESEARRIDAALEPNDVLLAVSGANHPELAAQLIDEAGGDVLLAGHREANGFDRVAHLEQGGRTRLYDERLQRGTVPTYSEEFFVAYDDDTGDESGIGTESTAGTRSMGGSVGTSHRDG